MTHNPIAEIEPEADTILSMKDQDFSHRLSGSSLVQQDIDG